MGGRADITGQRFGHLVAIEPTEERRDNSIVWRCVCDCGREHLVTAKDLRKGNTKSCGCQKRPIFDLTGLTFGRLTVVAPTGRTYQNNQIWHCVCSCGNEVDVMGRSLTSGNTKSCGCLSFEKRSSPPDSLDKSRASMLNNKIPSNNTSGIRGVSYNKRSGKWSAYIKFKGVFYHLGMYKDIGDAEKARKEAESKTFEEFLDYYTELKLRRFPLGRKPNNIRGKKFGKLTALYPLDDRSHTSVVWKCQCDCGALLNVRANHLISGHTTQCPACRRKQK